MKKSKNFFLLLFAFCLLLIYVFPAHANTVQTGLVKTTGSANVRTAPGVDAEIAGRVLADTYYRCMGEENNWYLIETNDGITGYISGRLCEYYHLLPVQDVKAAPLVQRTFTPGEVVLLGSYEQDYNLQNGAESIEWIVLEQDEEQNQLLLISRFALDRQHFHTTNSDATWETSGLRKWLNTTFLQNAFTTEEQAMILHSTVTADRNEEKNVTAGKDTQDYVFLLSIQEAEKYLTPQTALCLPTACVVVNNGYCDPETSGCWWWLRSPGHNRMHTAYVNGQGIISSKGYGVISNRGAVRPVIRVSLDQLPVE